MCKDVVNYQAQGAKVEGLHRSPYLRSLQTDPDEKDFKFSIIPSSSCAVGLSGYGNILVRLTGHR